MNTAKNVLHLCIATGQNTANFIPLKQLGAQEVWILETPSMKQQRSGANLSQALKPYVPTIRCIDFDDSSPQAIGLAAAKLAENHLDGRDVVFHITGGTKLMVLAIHQELSLLNTGHDGAYRTLYADTTHLTLDWMGPQPTQQAMQDVLTLQDMLLVRGYRTTNDTRAAKDQQRAAARAAVSRYMGENTQSLGRFFSTLAYKANQAGENGLLEQRFDYPPGGASAKLLKLAAENGLLQWANGQDEITFTDKDSARFFAGGWAEEYIFLKLPPVFAQGQYAMNVKVSQNQSKTENELDAIVVKNNRALLIECKSGQQSKAQESIYKLAQVVKQIGGLMAKGLYISAQPLTDADRQRAKEYNIDVLAAEELPQINAYLRDWRDKN